MVSAQRASLEAAALPSTAARAAERPASKVTCHQPQVRHALTIGLRALHGGQVEQRTHPRDRFCSSGALRERLFPRSSQATDAKQTKRRTLDAICAWRWPRLAPRRDAHIRSVTSSLLARPALCQSRGVKLAYANACLP